MVLRAARVKMRHIKVDANHGKYMQMHLIRTHRTPTTRHLQILLSMLLTIFIPTGLKHKLIHAGI